MEGIHPSIWRNQLNIFARLISETLRQGHIDLANCYRGRLNAFRERYIPWAKDADIAEEIHHPLSPAILVMEKIARDYLLYPSTNPGKLLFFQTKDEAVHYAARHFATVRIEMAAHSSLSTGAMRAFAGAFSG